MAITTYTIPAEKIVHNTSVDFSSRFSIINPIHIVQYDNSLPIISVELKNDNKTYVLPTDIEVWIRWKKQDNTFVRKQALGCNSERNTAYFEISQQMVMQYGLFKPVVELIIPSDSSDPSVASSGYFSVLVDRNPIQNGDVESMTEYEDPYGNVCYTKTAIDDMLIEKADKATTLAGYGITDALSNANESVKASNIADKSITLEKLAEEVIALLGSGGSGGGTGGITATQLAETLKNYVTVSTHTSDLNKKEGVTNKVTSFDQNFVDTSNVKYPTVLALLKYLEDYYYDYSDIYATFDGIRIDDDGNLIVLLPDGEEKSLGSVKGSDYVLTDTDKTEIANIVINEYDSSIMAILGGGNGVTE